MPANVGEMFYHGEIPWHGLGMALAKPATWQEAMRAGGLEWKVGDVQLQTCDDPPSPVKKRKAIIRLDRPAGDSRRVLGVAHQGFRPVQNVDAVFLFDAIFGQGKPVYHTGGYLGEGEVIWLLAKIDRPILVGRDDIVEPYALLCNSHDGSRALSISLTTVRVVCQNTLEFALQQKMFGKPFRRAHHSSVAEHASAAFEYWQFTLQQIEDLSRQFVTLSTIKCPEKLFESILLDLLPLPTKPRNLEKNPGLLKAYELKVEQIMTARDGIRRLRQEGKGMDLESANGTLWGMLNAVTEYVDHHQATSSDRLAYALLGDGMILKSRAYQLIQRSAAQVN